MFVHLLRMSIKNNVIRKALASFNIDISDNSMAVDLIKV